MSFQTIFILVQFTTKSMQKENQQKKGKKKWEKKENHP